jgi:hypothetical protein
MNANNQQIISRLVAELDRFVRGDVDLEGVQATLQSMSTLLEQDESGVGKAVRSAESDIEEIRFTKLRDEQRAAAIFRLDDLRDQLVQWSGP